MHGKGLLDFSVVLTALSLLASPTAAQMVTVEPEAVGELGMSWRFEALLEPGERLPMELREPPVLTSVTPCSPAHLAGLEPGDVLLEVDDRDARAGNPFPRSEPGTRYVVQFRRGDVIRRTELEVGPARPDAPEPVETAPVGDPGEWECEAPSRE